MQISGRPLLSTYNTYSSQLGNQWWDANVISPLKQTGHPIFFVPYFDRSDPNTVPPTYDNWNALIGQFPSIDGLLLFSPAEGVPFYSSDPAGGHQAWSGLETEENEARALHDHQKYFISPYQPYLWETCKGPRPYFEYQGGRGMDNYWRSAISKQHADMVSLVTWDDYSESTFVEPTPTPLTKYPGIQVFPHLAYYELERYYISWFKTNNQPTITKDALFVFYRTHRNAAIASNDASVCPLGPIADDQKWGLVTDSLYITTALTAPAEVVVQTGSVTQTISVPAGLSSTDLPFQTGSQVFMLRRAGRVLANITGVAISANPVVYNFHLFSAYAVAGGANSNNWVPSASWNIGTSSPTTSETWFVP